MKNILFRVDSSSTIGTGHVMRDLVLAAQFEGENIIFATQNLSGNINHTIKASGFEIELLESNDLEELIGLIKKYSVDWVVIDHYKLDYKFEKKLKEKTNVRLLVLDDTYEKHYCDILLNHNVTADPDKYMGLVPRKCEVRCGPTFTLLRDEFKSIKKKQRDILGKGTLSVFIAMGGADHANKNIDILNVINKLGGMNVNLVTTSANKHLKELKAYVNNHKNIELHINTSEIALLMNEADFAIVTPSVTVNETIFMKLPFVAIQTADNQSEIALFLQVHGFQVLSYFEEKKIVCELKRLIEPDVYNATIGFIETILIGRGIDANTNFNIS